MERVGVFVDAGYLFAAGGQLIAGTKVRRSELDLDVSSVVEILREVAEKASGLPLLRIYWYDGTDSGPTRQHTDLAFHDDVKVRLGIVNKHGEQKGVDSLLVTDMINLARHRAMASAVLITGDEDIRVGVQQAQEHGVRVHLIGIEPADRNQSSLLVQEADRTMQWGSEELSRFLRHRSVLDVDEISVSSGEDPEEIMAAVVEAVVNKIPSESRAKLRLIFDEGETKIPAEYDRALLVLLGKHFGPFGFQHKVLLRKLFRERI